MGWLGLLLACTAFGQKVETRDNNVFFTGVDGQRIQLTSGNRDLFPVLSPDGRAAAFIRFTSEVPEGDEINMICVVQVRLGEPPPKCATVRYQPEEDPLGGFSRPVWSADGKTVYFLADFSAVTNGLCKFEVAEGTATFISPVNAIQNAEMKAIVARLEQRL